MRVAMWGARSSFVGALLASTCCVLPSVLTALGLGGAVASAASAVPALTVVSAHKLWLFAGVGLMLIASWGAVTGRVTPGWLRARVCPTGAAPRHVRRLWRMAAALYVLSVAVAYLGAPVARMIWR